MIRDLTRYVLMAGFAMMLAGCVLRQQPAPVEQANPGQSQQPAQPVTPAQPAPPQPMVPSAGTVPQQPGPIMETAPGMGTSGGNMAAPQVRSYNWSSAVQPMVNNMLASGGASAGSILLVDSVNNHTNGTLRTAEGTKALLGAVASNKTFKLVTPQQLNQAKQSLGLSPNDSLGTRSKALGIARKVGAQYVLYTSATGKVNAPGLRMQLMTVQTGEIVWSGNGSLQQSH